MAGDTVKNRLRLFEGGATMTGNEGQPGRSIPAVLKKFPHLQKDVDSGVSSPAARSENKAGNAPTVANKPPVAVKGSALGPGKDAGSKPVKKWGGCGGGVNTNKKPAVQQDHNQNDMLNESSSSPSTFSDANHTFAKTTSNESTTSNSSVNSTNTANTQSGRVPTALTALNNKRFPSIAFAQSNLRPATPPKPVAKTASTEEESSGSDITTKSGQSPSNVLKNTAGKLPSNSSSTSTSSESATPNNFHSHLRSTTNSDNSSLPTSSKSSLSSPTPSTNTTSTTATFPSSALSKIDQWKDMETSHPRATSDPAPCKAGGKSGDSSVDLRQQWTRTDKRPHSKNSIILERKHDGKKFRKVNMENLPPLSQKPEKPSIPLSVDLSKIKDQYQKAMKDFKGNDDESANQEEGIDSEDNIYTDGTSLNTSLPRQSTSIKRISQRISMIPVLSPEEEGADVLYDDGITPIEDDVYQDGQTEMPQDMTEDNIYEDEGSTAKVEEESEQEKKKRLKIEEDTRKREEREQKEKEKRDEQKRRKEEKEQQNKEKEGKRLREKFKLTGDEIDVGEGFIKHDAKGKGDSLAVKKGQMVTIVRLDKNPTNKWLIRSGNAMGYVDSSLIEIDPAIIKQAMKRQTNTLTVLEEDDDQPTYDQVPPEYVDEFSESDDIYEAI